LAYAAAKGMKTCRKHRHRGDAGICAGSCVFRFAGNLPAAAPPSWAWAWRRQARRRAGTWLDWTLIPAAIEIAALSALFAYMASQLVLRRRLQRREMPFGLFFGGDLDCWLLGVLVLQG